LYFHIKEGKRAMCFIEEVPSKTIVAGYYENPDIKERNEDPSQRKQNVIIKVYDPDQAVVFTGKALEVGEFRFTTHEGGEYVICAEPEIVYYVQPSNPLRFHLHIETADKATNYEEVAKKETQRAKQRTIFDTIFKIAKEEGFLGLYAGLQGEMLKGFLSHGLTMLMKERIHKVVIHTYYLILRLLQRYPSPQALAKATGSAAATAARDVAEKAKGQAETVKETVQDGADKAQSALKNVTGQTQEVLDKSVDEISHLYRQGKESTMDIVDEYIDTEDD